MSVPDFDPYHEWLGIPPEEQPANHYRLLGLELFEEDRDVIESVSLEQIAHIRTFAIGANSEQSQLLLNELSAARLTLLNAVQKADYDQELRQQLNISPPPIEAISDSAQQTVTVPPPSATPRPEVTRSEEIERATSDPNSKQKLYISVGAGIALTLVIVVCSIFYLRAQRVNQAVAQALSQGDYQAALELDPANEQALSMRRTAELVRFALDRRDYREVLRLDPTNAQGLELKKASELGRALADGDYSRALEIDPNNVEALEMKDAADLRQALADGDYSRALEVDPGNAEALAMKDAAELLQALADGDYVRALEIDPNNVDALAMKRANAPPPAIAPFGAAKATEHQEAWAKYLGVEVETENSIGMMLSVIPAGTFTMGENDDAHKVTLTKPFMLGAYEVTQGQYERVMKVDPSKFKDANNPVEMVSWNDAVEFCRRLNELPAEKTADRFYALPTESQWEYACRAGKTNVYSFGDNAGLLGTYAWYKQNSGKTTHAVGRKKANPWGLCDMHGNVWEWCSDWYGDYPDRNVTDPTGPIAGSNRVRRGGSWLHDAVFCQSANRYRTDTSGSYYDVGFRVACVVKPKGMDTTFAKYSLGADKSDQVTTTTAPTGLTPPPANAPFNLARAREHQESWARYVGIPYKTENAIGMEFCLIPPGRFTMGEGSAAHSVTLSSPFMIGRHEVTQAQYQKVMGLKSSQSMSATKPVQAVSWDNAVEFCRKLSELPAEKAAGNVYRLPTEAEWEHACRAGTTTKFHIPSDDLPIDQFGWFSENANAQVQPVGSKQANAWELHDMHGNVWEWCNDGYAVYPTTAVTDPKGKASSQHVVARGGGFRDSYAKRGASSDRHYDKRSTKKDYIGFRVCLDLSGQPDSLNSAGNTTFIEANEGAAVNITGSNKRIIVTGCCTHIKIGGSGHHVFVKNMKDGVISLSGIEHEIHVAGSAAKVIGSGNSHAFTIEEIGYLQLSGSQHSLDYVRLREDSPVPELAKKIRQDSGGNFRQIRQLTFLPSLPSVP